MHERAALGIDLHRSGVAIRPPIADAEHEIRLEHRGVAVAMTGLQPDHAGHQPVIIRNRAPAHERRNHRHIGDFCELDQQRTSVGIDDATACDDQRPRRGIEHRKRFFDLRQRCLGLVDG